MRFFYGFGFETPTQRANNNAKGWDDEDSAGMVIEADSEEEAEQWGRAVAEAFYKWMYQDPEESWEASGYADYIELETESRWTPEEIADLPVIAVGQMPDLTRISQIRTPPPPPR